MKAGPDPAEHSAPSLGESALDFVSARAELLSLEAREAGRHAAKRGILIAVIAFCAATAWLATVAGIIGWIAAGGKIPWHFAALGVAIFHLLIAAIVIAVLRRPSPPAFPLSKAELTKDREWLLNLKDKPKR